MPVTFRPKTTKIAQRAQQDPLLYEMLRDLGQGLTDLWRAILALFAERVTGTPGYLAKFGTTDSITDSVAFELGGNIGLGTTTPAAPLHVVRSASAPSLWLDGYGQDPLIYGRRARGTPAAPTQALSGDAVLGLFGYAYGTTGFVPTSVGAIAIRTAENVTDTAVGGIINFATTKVGTTSSTLAVRIRSDQDVEFTGAFKGFRTKTLTEGAATGFADISIPSGETLAGECLYAVEASDGTDHQTRSGRVRFVAVNKAGVVTASINEVGTQEVAVSAGTLTVTNTVTAGASKITLESNATSSLAQTVLRVRYRIDVLSTTALITPL